MRRSIKSRTSVENVRTVPPIHASFGMMLVASPAWNCVTDRTAVSIGRLLRVMMPCSADTTCAPTNTGSL
eukprot:389-Eustigmatos_ZCMA.PRE.1